MDEDAKPNPRGFGPCLIPTMKMTEEYIANGMPIVVIRSFDEILIYSRLPSHRLYMVMIRGSKNSF